MISPNYPKLLIILNKGESDVLELLPRQEEGAPPAHSPPRPAARSSPNLSRLHPASPSPGRAGDKRGIFSDHGRNFYQEILQKYRFKRFLLKVSAEGLRWQPLPPSEVSLHHPTVVGVLVLAAEFQRSIRTNNSSSGASSSWQGLLLPVLLEKTGGKHQGKRRSQAEGSWFQPRKRMDREKDGSLH